jgi:hypothetical protein
VPLYDTALRVSRGELAWWPWPAGVEIQLPPLDIVPGAGLPADASVGPDRDESHGAVQTVARIVWLRDPGTQHGATNSVADGQASAFGALARFRKGPSSHPNATARGHADRAYSDSGAHSGIISRVHSPVNTNRFQPVFIGSAAPSQVRIPIGGAAGDPDGRHSRAREPEATVGGALSAPANPSVNAETKTIDVEQRSSGKPTSPSYISTCSAQLFLNDA